MVPTAFTIPECSRKTIAPSHRSKHTVAFFLADKRLCIYIEPPIPASGRLRPNSPDLNPMDYSIWGPLQQLVYRQKIDKVDHLKQVLNSCWDMISEELIDGPIERRSKRLSFIIRSHGGHITH